MELLSFSAPCARFAVAVLIGAALGAALGYFGQCTSGTCPLTSTWWRGAIYGGVMGLLFAATSGAPSRKSSPASSTANVAADVAPAWELRDMNGKITRSADFAGKVVVLNFWATWCPPCRHEIPDLVAFQKEFEPRGASVIGVAMGESADVKPFAAKTGINYPVVFANPETIAAFGGISAVPTTLIIDRQGKILSRIQGAVDLATLRTAVEAAL